MDDEKCLAVNERPMEGMVLRLPCHLLADHPLSTGFYDQAHLAGLTVSIKETGLLEPILVRPFEGGLYQILSGHYRLRAVRRLRWTEVTCRIEQCDDRTALVIYCTSNLLTRGLCAIEEACLLAGLIKEGFTMKQAGALWGRSKSWVSRRVKLLTALDPQITEELGLGRLKPRLAQELARLPRGNHQARVLAAIKKHCLNKDEAAALINRWLTATQEERARIETAGLSPPLAVLPREEDGKQARAYVTGCLKQCIPVIEDVTGFLREQKTPFKWWPKREYQTFLETVDNLDELVHAGKVR